MATPIAHKGATAGAKAQALTMLDILMTPALVDSAWSYFKNVQTKKVKYQPLIRPEDKPATELNTEILAKYRPEMKKFYYDPVEVPELSRAARDFVSDPAQGGRELRRDAESVAVSD